MCHIGLVNIKSYIEKFASNFQVIPFFFSVPIVLFPIVFLYAQNVAYAGISQTLIPIIVFLSIAATSYLIFYSIFLNVYMALTMEIAFMIFIENYALIEDVTSGLNLKIWHIIIIFIFILFNIGFIFKYMIEDIGNSVKKLFKVISLIFSGLIVFNLIIAAPTEFKKSNYHTNNMGDSTIIKTGKSEYPNFYYFILDEYSSFDNMKKYFGYDNTELRDILVNNKFTIAEGSFNTSFASLIITGNILNLDYVQDRSMSVAKSKPYRNNSKLFELLKKSGYETYSFEPTFDEDWIVKNANHRFESIRGANLFSDLKKLIFERSIFKYSMLEKQNSDPKITEIPRALNEIKEVVLAKSEKPKFVYAHILSPHSPTVFKADGLINEVGDFKNFNDPSIYLGEVKYITSKIGTLIDTIIEADPNCVILIQSDHSERFFTKYMVVNKKSRQDISTKELISDTMQTLNAVYYKGQAYSKIHGLSGVNTVRSIMKDTLNIPLENVKDFYASEYLVSGSKDLWNITLSEEEVKWIENRNIK